MKGTSTKHITLFVLHQDEFNTYQKEVLKHCHNKYKEIKYIHVHNDNYFYPFDVNEHKSKFTGDGFSSGFIIVCYFDYLFKNKWDVYGMNWNSSYHYMKGFEKDTIKSMCTRPCEIYKTASESY